jgi:hypothetical protein
LGEQRIHADHQECALAGVVFGARAFFEFAELIDWGSHHLWANDLLNIL